MEKCKYCGFFHSGHCPKIKSIEYFEDGTVKKVEFFGEIVPTIPEMIMPPIRKCT